MIYVVTYLRNGRQQFCSNHYTGMARCATKHEAERTVKENAGREDLTLRAFKNLAEACAWRNAENKEGA